MGRVTDKISKPLVTSNIGRVSGGKDNSNVEPILNPKSWEQMGFGEKAWNTMKNVPSVLYDFIPSSVKEAGETAIEEKRLVTLSEALKGGIKGAIEFPAQIGGMVAQGIGGAILGAKQLITKKPEKVEIPYVSALAEKLGLKEIPSEISSYQVQKQELVNQGFSDNEAKALVGINAYLAVAPVIGRSAKTKLGIKVGEKITTKEVPFEETPEGIKAKIKTEIPKEVPPTRIERPIITGIKRVFGKTEEQKQFNELLQEHLDKYFEGREILLGKEDPLNKALIKLNDSELKTYSESTQGLVSVEKPSANLKNAIELWRKTNAEIEADLIKRGKLTAEQAENRRWKPVEMKTGRTRAELKELGVDPIYYPYLAEDLLKKSDFISSTGRRTKGGYLKRFTGKMLQENSYIKDPKIAIPRNRIQIFRDKMNSELVDNIRTTFAEQDKMIINKYKNNPKFADQMGVEEWKPTGSLRFYPITEQGIRKGTGVTKKVESYWIPKDVASELNKFSKPGIVEKALRLTYDPLIDMWRVSVLGLVPRWLYNNFIGNTMLSVLGKTDPFAFLKSAREMIKPTGKIPEKGVFMKQYAGGEMAKAGKFGGLPKEQTQFLNPINNWLNLLEQAKNYKTLRIPATATQGLIRGWIALGKPIGYLNKVIENWFRGAMYISKTEGKFLGFQLDKPVPPTEGIKYVNEFLFDYTKLSRVERTTFRRALPFYNWMKNITNFSLKFPTNHPIRGLVVGTLLQDYIDYINEVNQKEDKVKSILRIKTEMTYEGKPLYLNVKSAIPFSDVFRTIPTDFETFGRFLTSNPVSKIIIERGFKVNSFTGQPFTQPPALQQFDEYGKPIMPLPSLPEHLGTQFPQTKIVQSIADQLKYGKTIKRYETGEPKIYRSQIQTSDLLMEIFGYFGIKLSATEYNSIQNLVDRKGRLQEVKSRVYKQQIKTGLERLKNQ